MTPARTHSVAVAGVVVDPDGRVLVVQRRDNARWEAPGGVLEPGETFQQGVAREVLEETGVQVSVEHLTGVYKNVVKDVIAIVFRCRPIAGDAAPTEESQRVEWWQLHEVRARMMPAFAVRITDAFEPPPAARAHDGVDLLDGVS